MGRPFPSAEGTGFAARRATGCGDPHQRLSALRPPWALGASPPWDGGKSPTAAGRTLPRNDGAWLMETTMSNKPAARLPHPALNRTTPNWRNEPEGAAESVLAERTRALRAALFRAGRYDRGNPREEFEWISELPAARPSSAPRA